MLDHSCQVQRHPLAERGLDLYETPAVAVEALLRVEKIPHRVWEPASGRGAIVNVLRARGPRARARAPIPQAAPHDAPRRMAGAQSQLLDGLRLVCVDPQSHLMPLEVHEIEGQ